MKHGSGYLSLLKITELKLGLLNQLDLTLKQTVNSNSANMLNQLFICPHLQMYIHERFVITSAKTPSAESQDIFS